MKTDDTGSAIVNADLIWIDLKAQQPPIGQKVLLINRAAGVATLGGYEGRAGYWTHWQGLPKFKQET